MAFSFKPNINHIFLLHLRDLNLAVIQLIHVFKDTNDDDPGKYNDLF